MFLSSHFINRPHRQVRRATWKPAAQGFTLIEIIVILAVISILVAILTPTVLKYIDDARTSRASEDVKTINAMLNDLVKDTGQYPGNKLAGRTFICGDGTQPDRKSTRLNSSHSQI